MPERFTENELSTFAALLQARINKSARSAAHSGFHDLNKDRTYQQQVALLAKVKLLKAEINNE